MNPWAKNSNLLITHNCINGRVGDDSKKDSKNDQFILIHIDMGCLFYMLYLLDHIVIETHDQLNG